MASSSEYCCCTGPSPNRGCQWAHPASASPADNNEEDAATLEKHQTFGFFGVPEKLPITKSFDSPNHMTSRNYFVESGKR